jgi:hypothetical protein
MNRLLKFRFPFAMVALVPLAGCSGDRTTSPTTEPVRTAVEAVTPTLIDGVVGKLASPAPVIRITDSKTHKPLANITVEFRAINGGSVATFSAVTDSTGLASPGAWTLGPRVGPSYLGAYINGQSALIFTAMLKPDIPGQLIASTSTDQAGLSGSSVAGPIVYVRDKFGNAVSGITVTFAIGDALTQSLDRSLWTSDATGRAVSGVLKLGSTPGPTHITASIPGVESVVFNMQILDPATIKWYSLDTVRVGAYADTPSAIGLSGARIAITAFDPCLCKKQEGFFLDELTYADGEVFNNSGRYVLDDATILISSLDDLGTIENGDLLLPRLDPDSDFGIVRTWVYKELR